MIHPSYSELIQAINTNSEEDDNTIMLNSRYSLVLATSKRARQIIGGSEPLVEGAAGKNRFLLQLMSFIREGEDSCRSSPGRGDCRRRSPGKSNRGIRLSRGCVLAAFMRIRSLYEIIIYFTGL